MRDHLLKKWLGRGHHLKELPIALLMPHSSCNCRCIMCDIWKGNARSLSMSDRRVTHLLDGFRKLGTRWVVLSGGEALLYPSLFQVCRAMKVLDIRITLLSTGLLLEKNAKDIVETMDEVIVSLDGPEEIHNRIRRVPDIYRKMADGIRSIHKARKEFPVAGRCVVQKWNFREMVNTVAAAKEIGLKSISFLPADVSSEAFNHTTTLSDETRQDIVLNTKEVNELKDVLAALEKICRKDFQGGFILESPKKLERMARYYGALIGQNSFPPVRCNAPWISAVIEPDGQVRPCFFHPSYGQLEDDLTSLINNDQSVDFRKGLDVRSDPTCQRCVCYLNYKGRLRF